MAHLKSVSFDQFSQIREETYYNEQTDEIETKRFQDVEPILGFNKGVRNDTPKGFGKNGEFHHVARIPLVVLEKWKVDGVIDWFKSTDAQRRKVLNDPANAFLRTRNCKL